MKYMLVDRSTILVAVINGPAPPYILVHALLLALSAIDTDTNTDTDCQYFTQVG